MKTKEQLKKATEQITKSEIEDTPFHVIEFVEKNEFFGCIGDYRLTDIYKNKKDAEKAVLKMDWNNIIKVVMVIIDKLKETKK